MKKLTFLTAAAAAMALAACTDSDDLSALNSPQLNGAQTADNVVSFSTNVGKIKQTRAGATGSIGTDTLKGFKYDGNATGDNKVVWNKTNAENYGFGVFAYYTGTKGFKDYNWYKDGSVDKSVANFMFNQLVWWNDKLGDDYVTKWTYEPLKYWPNEVVNGGVDDQDNDQDNDNATTIYQNGGNVSFFAYAPYVTLGTTDITTDKGGITAINGATTLASANVSTDEPYLTYKIPTSGKNVVDLLWGTANTNSVNVVNAIYTPTTGANESKTTESAKAASDATNNTYAASLLKGYKTNTDVTKQTTGGTVGFLFKHALAKVGGSTTKTPGSGDDVKNGFMVVLDLDDLKGAETGGAKEDATKVTVKSVKVVARTLTDNNDKTPEDPEYSPTYITTPSGDFNLATGIWKVSGTTATDQPTEDNSTVTIVDQVGPRDADANVTGELNEKIKEPTGNVNNWNVETGKVGIPDGVLTTAQNIYKDGAETFPLVFIPGTYPELTITIDYLVRTKDDNLAAAASGGEGAWTKVEQVITKKLTFTKPVELNKQYSILMHLGLTGVKFTASVSDWEVEDGTKNFDSDGDGTADIKVEDVWLPINVGSLIVAYNNAAESKGASGTKLAKSSSDIHYYTIADGKSGKVTVSGDLAFDEAYSSSKAEWITAVDAATGELTLDENADYKERTGTFKLKYTSTTGAKIYSDIITITQKGKTPEEVNITFTTDPALSPEKAATANDVTFAINEAKVTVKGKESDGTTAFTQTDVVATDLVFIDDATGSVATWITKAASWAVASGTWNVAANPSTSERSATLYAVVKGKRVVVKSGSNVVRLTQKGLGA